MNNWWNTLSGLEKFFWVLAIPSTAVFIFQMIMLIIGIDYDSDLSGFDGGEIDIPDMDLYEDISSMDIDSLDSNPHYGFNPNVSLKLFTIRNVIVFITVFSWAGITGIRNNFSIIGAIFFAVVLASIVVLLLSFVFYMLLKLTQSGNVDIRNAIGSEGEVYLNIPKGGKEAGKVQVTFQGALRDYDAITYGKALKTGTKIKIIGIKGDILLVEKINKEGEL